MATARKRAPAAAGGRMWLLGMGSGLLLVMAAPVAALAGVLLLPSCVVWFADRSPSKGIIRIVLVAGLAMSVGPISRLWAGEAGWALAAEILSDVRIPASAWAVQGGAWLAGELLPLIIKLFLDVIAATRAARLRAARKGLEEDWGLSPADGPL